MTQVQTLNKRKTEIINQQELMLKKAVETKSKLSETDEAQYKTLDTELADIDNNIVRFTALSKSRSEIATPNEEVLIGNTDAAKKKFYAMGGWPRTRRL